MRILIATKSVRNRSKSVLIASPRRRSVESPESGVADLQRSRLVLCDLDDFLFHHGLGERVNQGARLHETLPGGLDVILSFGDIHALHFGFGEQLFDFFE